MLKKHKHVLDLDKPYPKTLEDQFDIPSHRSRLL